MVYWIHYATMFRPGHPFVLPDAAKALLPETWIRTWRQRSLSSAFRSALPTSQVSLVYQPVVELASGRHVGAEALLRWRRRGEFVPPDSFIGAAEHSGFMKQRVGRDS
jgi:sensor c-di-GMP phosphodiesterase-like protein